MNKIYAKDELSLIYNTEFSNITINMPEIICNTLLYDSIQISSNKLLHFVIEDHFRKLNYKIRRLSKMYYVNKKVKKNIEKLYNYICSNNVYTIRDPIVRLYISEINKHKFFL
jgi:hypothetical protein